MDHRYQNWSRDSRLFHSTMRVLHPDIVQRYAALFEIIDAIAVAEKADFIHHSRCCGANQGQSLRDVIDREPTNDSVPFFAVPLRDVWEEWREDRHLHLAVEDARRPKWDAEFAVQSCKKGVKDEEGLLARDRDLLNDKGIASYEARIEKAREALRRAEQKLQAIQQDIAAKEDMVALLSSAPDVARQRFLVEQEIKTIRERPGADAAHEDPSVANHLKCLEEVRRALIEKEEKR